MTFAPAAPDARPAHDAGGRTLALTTGEPAGIGPEISVAAAAWFAREQHHNTQLILIGDPALLQARAAQVAHDGLPPFTCPDTTANQPTPVPGWPGVWVQAVPLAAPCTPGVLNTANSAYVLRTLDAAIAHMEHGTACAIVTAPVHKAVINDAGHAFSGHTEYFQERAGVPKVVMMLAGGGLRVALATTHLPLRAVADAVTPRTLDQVLRILDTDLRRRWCLAQPRIAVCGLNPHAGEGGHLGREEIDVIEPAIAAARAAGIDAHGPFPADTLFVPRYVADYDAALAMYHDQGLPVLKHASFGLGVNITLGLPYVRTSVDHGTALTLAGTGQADAGSLREAIKTALEMTASASPAAMPGAD